MPWNISTDTIAQYKCNDNLATTNVIDEKGSYNGTSVANTNTMSVAGKINNALQFESASSDSVLISNTIPMKDGPWSLIYWVNGGSQGASVHTFTKRAGSSSNYRGFSVRSDATNTYMRIDTSAAQSQDTTINSVYNSNWHMIVWIINNGSIAYSLDGANLTYSTYSVGAGLENDTDDFSISDAASINLTLDNIIIMNRAITNAEIIGVYNNGTGTELLFFEGIKYYSMNSETNLVTGNTDLNVAFRDYHYTTVSNVDAVVVTQPVS